MAASRPIRSRWRPISPARPGSRLALRPTPLICCSRLLTPLCSIAFSGNSVLNQSPNSGCPLRGHTVDWNQIVRPNRTASVRAGRGIKARKCLTIALRQCGPNASDMKQRRTSALACSALFRLSSHPVLGSRSLAFTVFGGLGRTLEQDPRAARSVVGECHHRRCAAGLSN